ncbi:hypothetical protein [Chitinophaga sp. S165]|uniref:hypothetical protein n=1 Tax=Chitinophaga sp. S165 TaxID=2135462 RepID=UPI000D93D585|nr:hypothetical protein [Chitinophaga sp. S165]PWV56856.1 hypothetical protein C7475_1011374 [Chitinophaga sp. S165]
MKAFSTTLSCAAVFVMSFLLTACSKDDHYPPGGQYCRVHQLIGRIGYDQDTITIKYNNKGNPVEMNRTFVSTGRPRFVFKYDKRDRLIDLIGLYRHPTNYEIRFRYAYDYKGRISSDTVYTLGFTDVPNRPDYLREYTYDNKDRLIQVRHKGISNPDVRFAYNYHYNQQGNLEKVTDAGGVVTLSDFKYDNKVNINSLHPIWQFLSGDYSRNNVNVALSYNAYGLPTAFDQGEKREGQFANIAFSNIAISYQCR